MPSRPEVRRERRAALRQLAPPKKRRRKRCDNCGSFFPKKRKDQRFCKKECKDQFHHYGSAFGPLRDWLLKHIERCSKENFDRKLLQTLSTAEGRAAMKAAGFIHRDELGDYTGQQLIAQIEMLVDAQRQLTDRVTLIEGRRKKALQAADRDAAARVQALGALLDSGRRV